MLQNGFQTNKILRKNKIFCPFITGEKLRKACTGKKRVRGVRSLSSESSDARTRARERGKAKLLNDAFVIPQESNDLIELSQTPLYIPMIPPLVWCTISSVS